MTGLTAKQMVYEAKIFYEDIASNNAPSFTDREWSVLLTNAQSKVVYEIYRKGFDDNEENRLGIQSLLTPYSQVNFREGTLPNSYILELKKDVMFITYESCKINSRNVLVLPVPMDAYFLTLSNPFKKPGKDRVWRVIYHDNTNLLISKYALQEYQNIYISRPYPIIVSNLSTPIEFRNNVSMKDAMNCKLHANLHRKIAHVAAQMAYGATQEQVGYQIQDIENKKS